MLEKKMRFHLIYIIRNPIIFFMIASRPIAGHANLCPGSISTKRQELDILLSTVKHEMLHALGFSVSLFAFYRDSEGKWWYTYSLICLVRIKIMMRVFNPSFRISFDLSPDSTIFNGCFLTSATRIVICIFEKSNF